MPVRVEDYERAMAIGTTVVIRNGDGNKLDEGEGLGQDRRSRTKFELYFCGRGVSMSRNALWLSDSSRLLYCFAAHDFP